MNPLYLYAQVLEEWTSTGTPGLSKVYNYGLDLISQRTLNPQPSTNYFVYDGHGSTRLLVDAGGNVANAFVYDAYGTLIASNTTAQTAYLYCGEQFDGDLGFYYLRARYYKPDTGRFWTMDTFEGNNSDPLSLHKYLYCADNPVDGIDPTGHAVYFVTRKFQGSGTTWAEYQKGYGHGYLMFTLEQDPGKAGDPIKNGWLALYTFSWHPADFGYMDGQGLDIRAVTPGRIWGNHPADTQPSTHDAYLVTADPAQQKALLTAIRAWITGQGVGFDFGTPQQDPNPEHPNNTIGVRSRHRDPNGDNPVYYSLWGQNCVWWATLMLAQNGIPLRDDVSQAILKFNNGTGFAKDVINNGNFKVRRMQDNLFNMNLRSLPGYTIDSIAAF